MNDILVEQIKLPPPPEDLTHANRTWLSPVKGFTESELNLLSASSSSSALTTLSQAIDQVAAVRSEYGAMQNRLQYTIWNLMNVSENTVAARSRIEDADFATESAVLAKTQVLQQTGAAMLAQANARPQLVLQLIK